MWVHRPHQVLKHDWAPETTKCDWMVLAASHDHMKSYHMSSKSQCLWTGIILQIFLFEALITRYQDQLITKWSKTTKTPRNGPKLPKHHHYLYRAPASLWSLWRHCVLLDCRSPGCDAKTCQVYQIAISMAWLGKPDIFYQPESTWIRSRFSILYKNNLLLRVRFGALWCGWGLLHNDIQYVIWCNLHLQVGFCTHLSASLPSLLI